MSKISKLNACPLAIALLTFSSLPALAVQAPAPTAGAYVTDQTRSYVEDATSQGLRLPNTVLCYMNGTGANLTEVLNKGDYISLVDKNKCENSGGSGNSASGNSGASSAPSYMRGIINSSRVDNNSPLIGKVWFLEDDMNTSGGGSTTGIIYARLSASVAASDTSPYGVFHTDFCGSPTNSGACAFYGYAEGNGASVSAFQTEAGGGGGAQSISMTLTGTTDSGAGRIKFSQGLQNGDWKFSYNANYFHRADNAGTNDQCFDRSFANADKTAWRYGVYNADGSRLERNGGFPIKAGSNYGYVGYWGLWLPSGVTLADGDTVTRFSYGGNQASQADYTLVKKDGRLKKLTRNATTLDGIKNVPFYVWSNNSNSEMKWDGTNLLITGTMANGGTVTPQVPAIYTPDPNTTWNITGWSQSLGGQVTIVTRNSSGAYLAPSSASVVTYLTESVLTPGGNGWPTNLYCVNGCPAGGTTFTDGLNGTGSPYQNITAVNFGGGTVSQSSQWNWNPVPTANVLAFTADAVSGLLKSGANSVAWTSPTAPTSQQFSNGFSSGRMVDATGLAALQCNSTGGTGSDHYCPNRMDNVDTTYVWETGSNSWNKFSGLKSGGAYVSFDPPLAMSYTVPATVSAFANANLVLQYNGFGDLQGIPGKCVNPVTNAEVTCANDNSTRWVAAFAIPEGATLTSNGVTYFVKPLEQELRLSKVAGANCASLTLPTILDAALPGVSSWNDPRTNGLVPPTVTGAPRVIHGVVQY